MAQNPSNLGVIITITFTHELGHALGLAHPHDTAYSYGTFPGVSEGSGQDFGDHKLNGKPWTVMSYNELNKKEFTTIQNRKSLMDS